MSLYFSRPVDRNFRSFRIASYRYDRRGYPQYQRDVLDTMRRFPREEETVIKNLYLRCRCIVIRKEMQARRARGIVSLLVFRWNTTKTRIYPYIIGDIL